MQRYVPPSRRRKEQADAQSELRSLEGAGTRSDPPQVRLVWLAEGELDTSSCPLDIERGEGTAPLSWNLFYPEREPHALLRWFADTCGDGKGRLEFPASLSKRERASWHGAAARAHLHTQSVGVGDQRHLTVCMAAPSDPGVDAPWDAAARPPLTQQQQQLAKAAYEACQMEGGRHWERSRGEIEAMVASGQPLPPDIQELVDRRAVAQRVCQLLRRGQPSEALELLSLDPRLAWVKDATSGGYPIHIAAWQGYESVVLFLASMPGVLEQRDGRRDSPLAVARRRGHAAIEELLLEAGAKPEQGADPKHGSAAALEAGEEQEYCSWSAEERLRYRRGGQGSSARQPGRSSGRAGAGRGGAASRSSNRATTAAQQEPQQPRCPW